MTKRDRERLLREGLGQIPRDGLERLRDVLASDAPVLLNGEIYESGRGG